MGAYDSRHITLDPGLTALALRGLRRRDGHYPFIERHARRRAIRRSAKALVSAWLPSVRNLWVTRPAA